jgi:SAM-dependent methyltransferase
MIRAADRRWNSPTTLYIARRLAQIAQGRRIAVLDMGCGDGATLEHLLDYGYELYGYDLAPAAAAARLASHFGAAPADRIRAAEDDRTIPFPSGFFDVVYANQVFEHVKFLDAMLGECARVLKSDGTLLANFPLATYPIEWHLKVPFAHWVPPGTVRVAYLWPIYALGLRPKLPGASARATALSQDVFLRERTFYRFVNEVLAVAGHYFGACEIETGHFIAAKRDLLAVSRRRTSRWLAALLRRAEGATMDYLVTYGFNAAFCMKHPRPRAGS